MDCRNKSVFSLRRNIFRDGAVVMSSGRLIYSLGPAVSNSYTTRRADCKLAGRWRTKTGSGWHVTDADDLFRQVPRCNVVEGSVDKDRQFESDTIRWTKPVKTCTSIGDMHRAMVWPSDRPSCSVDDGLNTVEPLGNQNAKANNVSVCTKKLPLYQPFETHRLFLVRFFVSPPPLQLWAGLLSAVFMIQGKTQRHDGRLKTIENQLITAWVAIAICATRVALTVKLACCTGETLYFNNYDNNKKHICITP